MAFTRPDGSVSVPYLLLAAFEAMLDRRRCRSQTHRQSRVAPRWVLNAAPPPLDEQSIARAQPLTLGPAAAATAGWQEGCRSRHLGIEAAALHARPGAWSRPAAPQRGAPHLE